MVAVGPNEFVPIIGRRAEDEKVNGVDTEGAADSDSSERDKRKLEHDRGVKEKSPYHSRNYLPKTQQRFYGREKARFAGVLPPTAQS